MTRNVRTGLVRTGHRAHTVPAGGGMEWFQNLASGTVRFVSGPAYSYGDIALLIPPAAVTVTDGVQCAPASVLASMLSPGLPPEEWQFLEISALLDDNVPFVNDQFDVPALASIPVLLELEMTAFDANGIDGLLIGITAAGRIYAGPAGTAYTAEPGLGLDVEEPDFAVGRRASVLSVLPHSALYDSVGAIGFGINAYGVTNPAATWGGGWPWELDPGDPGYLPEPPEDPIDFSASFDFTFDFTMSVGCGLWLREDLGDPPNPDADPPDPPNDPDTWVETFL